MKRSTIYLLAIALAGLLLGWGVVLVYHAFKSSMEPSVCICTVSAPASDQAAQALIKLIEQAILEKKGSLASATQAVQKEFPYCTSISCRQQPSGVVQAQVEIDEPFCAVNDDRVLTTRGIVVLRSLYADEAIVGLPQLRLDEQKESAPTSLPQKDMSVSPYLLSFLRHIPDSLFSTHEIIYRSDDEIAFVQRDTKLPLYLCAVDTVVDRDLLTRCDKVLADFEQQKMTTKKRARTAVVLDLRFDKQIILYPHVGGQIHG